jgi:hypothetical protein
MVSRSGKGISFVGVSPRTKAFRLSSHARFGLNVKAEEAGSHV